MSSPPPTIELRRSRTLCAALLVLAACAGAAVGLSDLPIAFQAAIPLLLWAAWPAQPVWRSISFGRAGAVVLDADIAAQPVELQRRGPLTIVSLRVARRVQRFVFTTPGTLRADERRRLSLWSGWRAHV